MTDDDLWNSLLARVASVDADLALDAREQLGSMVAAGELVLALEALADWAWTLALDDGFWAELFAAIGLDPDSGVWYSRFAASRCLEFGDSFGFAWRGIDGSIRVKAMDGHGEPLVLTPDDAVALADHLCVLAEASGYSGDASGEVEVTAGPPPSVFVDPAHGFAILTPDGARDVAGELRAN